MINNILHNALIAITNNSDDTFNWNTPLTFTAQEPNSAVRLVIEGGLAEPTPPGGSYTEPSPVQYRTNTNSEWSTYIIGTWITLTAVDDYVQFQASYVRISCRCGGMGTFLHLW